MMIGLNDKIKADTEGFDAASALKESGKALALEPGKVYAIECDHMLSCKQQREVADSLQIIGQQLGCKFILLMPGMRIAREQNAEVPAIAGMSETDRKHCARAVTP